MKYVYEAVIEKSGRFFEARFPDLDIITQGDDLRDAALMAYDLLENHIVLALQNGRQLPDATFGNDCGDGGYRMGIVVDCDKDTPQDETMSVSEAADLLDVSNARVRAMIRDGILKSRKVGKVHMVDADSVIRRYNAPVHAGRPKAMQA